MHEGQQVIAGHIVAFQKDSEGAKDDSSGIRTRGLNRILNPD